MSEQREHTRRRLFGHLLSVVTLDDEKYLVGVQIASLLKRETFNMYRSMKIKEISIRRASPEEIDFLCKCGAVRGGTHSVTLIPFAEALYFIADARSKAVEAGVRKANKNLRRAAFSTTLSFVETQPRIHRRKPFPWDLRRSLRHQDLVQYSKVSGTNSSIYLVEQPCVCLPKNPPPQPAQSTTDTSKQVKGSKRNLLFSSVPMSPVNATSADAGPSEPSSSSHKQKQRGRPKRTSSPGMPASSSSSESSLSKAEIC